MAEESVKVAVRVRPFNKREIEANAKLCVAMSGPTTIVTNPADGEEKKFAYDHSYWSFDGFTEQSDGYNKPDSSGKYHDQEKVYNDLGKGVLENAWEGYNASLFAYGQTGSGKSYSVVGYGKNKGIVPLVCEDIFKTAATITGKTIEVYFSMLEIYSEAVRDLLNPVADRKKSLAIRQDPQKGFYAQGLKKTLVNSYEGIVQLTDEGTANRTIASTNMNATSSRAHTIVAVTLIQKYTNEAGKEMAKSSTINLVDLAGSERADATGATGQRLKEGAAINLSLTSLGNVISALADNSSGKNVKVPYRDSSLTKLLCNALGGNSKTIMIAAISPADINFEESVSTLRYADRAKQIKTKAVVNEDPTEKLIRDLKSENARLKALLEGGNIDLDALGDGSSDDVNDAEKQKQLAEMNEAIEENNRQMEEMEKTYEEKLKAALAAQAGHHGRDELLAKAKTTPHLTNLNMDPSLCGTLKLLLEGDKGKKTIGSPKTSDIGLYGIGILDNHGAITFTKDKFSIERFDDAKILKNGRPITGKSELHHLDRLVFGCSQFYLFVNPAEITDKDTRYSFEMAQEEIGKASGTFVKDTKNMTQDEILCMTEMMDLLPEVEEANMMSITLDKKTKYSALAVSSASRGDYDPMSKAFISVKNFAQGLEWIWTKEKFMDRKVDMAEFYLDFKDNGIIDNEKYKDYDPFFESPDTPTQVGTAILYPSSFAHMISFKGDFKILDFKSKDSGSVSVEILPCQANGEIIDPSKSGKIIRDPQNELLNKNINFIIKINNALGLNEKFEDIYAQFQVFSDPTIYKTEVIRGTNNPQFKYKKQFTFQCTPRFLDYVLNKPLYIQIWSEQKHPKPKKQSQILSTKEYFNREKETINNVSGKTISNKIDPEKETLKNDLELERSKAKQAANTLKMVEKLVFVAKESPIPGSVVTGVMNAPNNEAADKIIKEFFETKSNDSGKYEELSFDKLGSQGNAQACNIL